MTISVYLGLIRKAANINQLWASIIIEELTRCGIQEFFISPGSRSTPLVSAIARHDRTRAIVHYDERGSFFAALGFAKSTGTPAVCVTTSGSALANGLPAVIEAFYDEVPLILLTADRPPELRGTGANQTIDQSQLFAPFTKWSIDASAPSIDVTPAYVLTTIDQAIQRATMGSQGPVHINWMFREPLAPTPTDQDFSKYCKDIEKWIDRKTCYTQYLQTKPQMVKKEFDHHWKGIFDVEEGLVIIGRLHSCEEGEASIRVAKALGWPVFVDIGSQVRLGGQYAQSDLLVVHDLAFAEPEECNLALKIKTVLQFGKRCISKRLQQWLEKSNVANYVVVDTYAGRVDPAHMVTLRLEADIVDSANLICDLAGRNEKKGITWKKNWRDKVSGLQAQLDALFSAVTDINEPAIAYLISKSIGDNHGLVIGNSMPVRDMDVFAIHFGPSVHVISNRGASGIDGTIATGAGSARGLNRPTTILLGDLAFLHDLNSLAILHQIDQPVIIVVLNNNGGGIFSFLPIANYPDIFEPYFGTPHNLSFSAVAELFKMEYHNPLTLKEFEACYKEALGRKQHTLIEIQTIRSENLEIHREFESILARLNQD